MVIDILRGVLGMAVLIGISFLLSHDRKNIDWKLVGAGLTLQIILAISILKVPFVYQMFDFIADKFTLLLSFTDEGAKFVFGDTWFNDVYLQTMEINPDGTSTMTPTRMGFMFAFKVLPTIVFFSAFSAILYYFGILQRIIFVFASLFLFSHVVYLF